MRNFIFYFISYAAYTYYSLFPYVVAFILLVVFTVLTVALSLYYNRQVIAHFGLAATPERVEHMINITGEFVREQLT